MVKIYSTNHDGPEIYENIQEKQCYGPVIINYIRKQNTYMNVT